MPNIDAAQAQARLGTKPAPYLLDVRQPEEYREGHISGANLIPLGDLPRRIKDLPRDREIICVCHSGNRSRSATRQLTDAGYNAVNLQGGMSNWTRQGLPVKKGSGK
ncbi:MAG TPA: rhodanese-like domain-containing protein [Anaerolineae bacterium]